MTLSSFIKDSSDLFRKKSNSRVRNNSQKSYNTRNANLENICILNSYMILLFSPFPSYKSTSPQCDNQN